ncbi:UDP-2,4-diacetamido-2,4, 6-trideoxy-beta-L-altropyranose hydrolase [Geobacter sp. OR-1]|uniref:UDP-2,4-diacetamido-2,4, 6-trideoxy-beta-L-altropyranose hydrolase n=1 Tax=Geobacter sp. OR-1 TaxID=1266765 RepID=UPI0005428D89|nr:UDP-2,4-diacetamido-2,4,6-trideoxy-beta-L-altropyranose hydrolase [Geobacter sp. OR-1]GAM09647.1 UDP-2,4-diacetamido-2,4, 6-trideoxy-beta-L-altropyranose hydrolase [Geobacter sp. OR-1]
MRFVIRADASVAIGSGHVMRCLTLAEALRGEGSEVLFVARRLAGDSIELIGSRGFDVRSLPGGDRFDPAVDAEQMAAILAEYRPDWLVVDHYGISSDWEVVVRPHVGSIMVIDDLADRPHDCDLLLDQNLTDGMASRYVGLLPPHCRTFIGPKYALLRPEFINVRKRVGCRTGQVDRLFIFFGGSDPTGETGKALRAISKLGRLEISIDVVVGAANPQLAEIKALCHEMPQVSFHFQVDNMAELMARADLAVGAGGTTTWERCFLGLPALLVVVADNQSALATTVAKAGLVRLLGDSATVTEESLSASLSEAIARPDELQQMSQACLELFGGRESPLHNDIVACLFGRNHATS